MNPNDHRPVAIVPASLNTVNRVDMVTDPS